MSGLQGTATEKESLAVTVGGLNIYQATNMSIVKFKEFMDGLTLTPMQQTIGASILKEYRGPVSVSLLMWDWIIFPFPVLQAHFRGSEQRIRLATQIGSGLVGVAISWMSQASDFTREIMINC